MYLVDLALAELYLGEFHPWLYGWVLSGLLGALICHWARVFSVMYWGSVVTTVSIAGGFTDLCAFSAEPAFWYFPIGVILCLAMAPFHNRPLEYVFAAVLIWLLIGLRYQPGLNITLETLFGVFVLTSSLLAGLGICVLLRQIRRKSYFLQMQLHTIGFMDALTGLPNRRAFMGSLERSVALKSPQNMPYCLMLDVDDFKAVNDLFGHDAGDLVLIEIARVIETCAQSYSCGRLGGEEFAVVAHVTLVDARALAQKIVQSVNTKKVQGRSLSISIGMARQRDSESGTNLLRRADDALYAAKRTGKNRYVLDES
jgi:diguanylate cyclase (GGDEF)-like protein